MAGYARGGHDVLVLALDLDHAAGDRVLELAVKDVPDLAEGVVCVLVSHDVGQPFGQLPERKLVVELLQPQGASVEVSQEELHDLDVCGLAASGAAEEPGEDIVSCDGHQQERGIHQEHPARLRVGLDLHKEAVEGRTGR